MFVKEINYDRDLPSRNINLFRNHRFLIMVKNTGLVDELNVGVGSGLPPTSNSKPSSDIYQTSSSSKGGPSMDTVDMQKIMGNSYFRQIENYRQGGAPGTSGKNESAGGAIGKGGSMSMHSADFLPANIVRILFNQRTSDCTEWFTKKAFSKPI